MATLLRPGPLLQTERTITVSNDNGTTTPLPLPLTDFWDINNTPNAGTTQEYQVTNISNYQGRIITINKTRDTAGATIRLRLPGGYTFNTTGNQLYTFPDTPIALILSFSSSSIVMIQLPGQQDLPNGTQINYQVPNTNTGVGNNISAIANSTEDSGINITSGPDLIQVVSGGDLTMTALNSSTLSAQGGLTQLILNSSSTLYGGNSCEIQSPNIQMTIGGSGQFKVSTLPKDLYKNAVYYDTTSKQLSYSSVFRTLASNLIDQTVPNTPNTACILTFSDLSLLQTAGNSFRVEIQGQFSNSSGGTLSNGITLSYRTNGVNTPLIPITSHTITNGSTIPFSLIGTVVVKSVSGTSSTIALGINYSAQDTATFANGTRYLFTINNTQPFNFYATKDLNNAIDLTANVSRLLID